MRPRGADLSAVSPSRGGAPSGTSRRRPGRSATRFGTVRGDGRPPPRRPAGARASKRSAAARAPRGARGASAAGRIHRRAPQEGGERPQPVARGRERRRAAPRAPQHPGDPGCAPRRPPRRSARAASRARVDPELAAGLRGRRARARRRRAAPARAGRGSRPRARRGGRASCAQRVAPVVRPAEVGDDATRARWRASARRARARRRARCAAGSSPRVAPQRGEQAEQAGRPWRGGSVGARVAEGEEAEPVAAPVARWPSARATPSATSALRRSAVPNCIDGDLSSTSHVSAPARRVDAHVRLAHARGHVPVDLAHVVAGHSTGGSSPARCRRRSSDER